MIGNSLKHHWSRHDVSMEPGVSETELKAFEHKYNVLLPDDLCNYFMSVNGMSPGMSDDSLFRFWMLSEVKPVTEGAPEYAGPNYTTAPDSIFLFADYCIWSHAFGIHLSEQEQQLNTVYVIGFSPAISIANSFSEFVDIYLTDKDRLTTGF
jgi:SMI1 / KNR4 family (SUKH-1)